MAVRLWKGYTAKIPFFVPYIYPKRVWRVHTKESEVFITFDDGPHPTITPWVINQLKNYNAKATFFCIGNNVEKNPEVFQQILQHGHSVGNHTYSHLNGFKTSDEEYMNDVQKAEQFISTTLFRPPYGKLTGFKAQLISKLQRKVPYKIVMWDVLSGDFDEQLTAKECTENVLLHTDKGSIIVFHDSEKAFPRLKETLPIVLQTLHNRGFVFSSLQNI